jgi:hypothetical protein
MPSSALVPQCKEQIKKASGNSPHVREVDPNGHIRNRRGQGEARVFGEGMNERPYAAPFSGIGVIGNDTCPSSLALLSLALLVYAAGSA